MRVLPIVVHLIDFSSRNTWIEKQLVTNNQDIINHVLISISQPGLLNLHLESIGVKEVYNVSKNAFGLMRFLILMMGFSRREEFVVYAHGHIPAVYAVVLKFLTGQKYIVCHHQPPNYFHRLETQVNLRSRLHSKLFVIYLKEATIIQSLSLETFQKLLNLGIPSRNIRKIPLGIDFSNFVQDNVKANRSNELIKITSIGRLVWEKRIDLAILTVAKLVEIGLPIKFDIIGEGPLRSELEDLVAHLGLVEKVSFLGWQENISEILRDTNVLLHLSVTESYGQVLMEARLCGANICSTYVGVAVDMAIAGDPKICILKGESAEELASEILNFLDSSTLRTEIDSTPPEILYKDHDFKLTLKRTELMFKEFFNSLSEGVGASQNNLDNS